MKSLVFLILNLLPVPSVAAALPGLRMSLAQDCPAASLLPSPSPFLLSPPSPHLLPGIDLEGSLSLVLSSVTPTEIMSYLFQKPHLFSTSVFF